MREYKFRRLDVLQGVCTLPLTRGKSTLVDLSDYPALAAHKWTAHRQTSGQLYAVRRERRRSVYMHRALLEAPPHTQVDHRDHDGLCNIRSNIRIATSSQNQANARKQRPPSTSPWKGVHWDRRDERWMAMIRQDGRTRNLGRFDSDVEAARAYNRAAIELFGEFALLNEVSDPVGIGEKPPVRPLPRLKPRIAGGTSSRYRGVCWNRRIRRWQASIKVRGRHLHLGVFPSEDDAARAYNDAAMEHHGDHAVLNDIATKDHPED